VDRLEWKWRFCRGWRAGVYESIAYGRNEFATVRRRAASHDRCYICAISFFNERRAFLRWTGADGEVEDYSVTVTPVADVAVAVSSVNAVAVGSNLTFTVAVTNGGPSTASSVSLTNQVQGVVNFVSITSSRGACSRTGNTISCA
jgi:uncharacterized repeat protein (TIGR01451 family)